MSCLVRSARQPPRGNSVEIIRTHQNMYWKYFLCLQWLRIEENLGALGNIVRCCNHTYQLKWKQSSLPWTLGKHQYDQHVTENTWPKHRIETSKLHWPASLPTCLPTDLSTYRPAYQPIGSDLPNLPTYRIATAQKTVPAFLQQSRGGAGLFALLHHTRTEIIRTMQLPNKCFSTRFLGRKTLAVK